MRALTPMLTGGALVTMALAFAYTHRPLRTDSLAQRFSRSRNAKRGRVADDIDLLCPDEALARVLARAARFKPNPHGEAEALASSGATWPFLDALDAVALETGEVLTRRRTTRVVRADPGEAFFEQDVKSEELEDPPTDSDPATVGDLSAFGTDLPVARFEETDDAIAPEDLGTEWLDREPSPRPDPTRR